MEVVVGSKNVCMLDIASSSVSPSHLDYVISSQGFRTRDLDSVRGPTGTAEPAIIHASGDCNTANGPMRQPKSVLSFASQYHRLF